MLGDLEGFIIFIPFIYLGVTAIAYFIMRRQVP